MLRTTKTLSKAWREVKSSALSSSSEEIQRQATEFDQHQIPLFKKIQTQLRKEKFTFDQQLGVTVRRPGKAPRPIVIAPMANRIVQRALLDVLQENVPYIQKVLASPRSFGGIKTKSVEKAIAEVSSQFKNGKKYFIKSDIPSFFTKVKRLDVLESVRTEINDPKLFDIFSQALNTELSNIDTLKNQGLASLFPIGGEGVAQGSSLSPLVANLCLYDFDYELNNLGEDVCCIRYIDDFVILGETEKATQRAFRVAKAILKRKNLSAYSPDIDHDKASKGHVGAGFEFLGCHIRPNLIQPSRQARKRLLESIQAEANRAIYPE